MIILIACWVALTAMPSSALAQAAPAPTWQPLFDGKTLSNWQSTKFGGEGAVKVENGQIVLEAGTTLSGITWSGPELPTTNYEIALQAMRVEEGIHVIRLAVQHDVDVVVARLPGIA